MKSDGYVLYLDFVGGLSILRINITVDFTLHKLYLRIFKGKKEELGVEKGVSYIIVEGSLLWL